VWRKRLVLQARTRTRERALFSRTPCVGQQLGPSRNFGFVCPRLSVGAQVARAHRCVPCLRPWCGRRRGTWSQAGWARQQRLPGSSVVLERPGRYGCSAGTSGALTQTRCPPLPATATYFRAGPACARQPGVVKEAVNEELRSETTRLARSSHSCCPLDGTEACAREGGFSLERQRLG
jgi:hypothetical protein